MARSILPPVLCLAAVGFFACGPKPPPSVPPVEKDDAVDPEPVASDLATLTGTAIITKVNHCGGVAPPIEVPYSSEYPYTGTILVRPGNENSEVEPVATIQSDTDGSFSMELPPGSYCLVRSSKKEPPTGPADTYTDADCLLKEWKGCDGVVEHPADDPLAISIYSPCFSPCYNGPMPP